MYFLVFPFFGNCLSWQKDQYGYWSRMKINASLSFYSDIFNQGTGVPANFPHFHHCRTSPSLSSSASLSAWYKVFIIIITIIEQWRVIWIHSIWLDGIGLPWITNVLCTVTSLLLEDIFLIWYISRWYLFSLNSSDNIYLKYIFLFFIYQQIISIYQPG